MPRRHLLTNVYILSQVGLYYIIAPLLMFIFGISTIGNIRRQSIRAIPLTASMRRRRTEGQLTRMLILQIVVHLLFVLPYGVVYCMISIQPLTQTPTVSAVRLVFAAWQQCDYFVSFFLYIFSGSVYRRELLRIFTRAKIRTLSTRSFMKSRKDVCRDTSMVTPTTPSAHETMNGIFV